MKLALVDEANFFGLSNDVVFTENWNTNFEVENKILVPLCNQKLIGQSGSLNIDSAMDIEEYEGRENDLNEFVKSLDVEKIKVDTKIIGFYCFYIPHYVLSRVGFLDENFENGGEDVDYRVRASQLGFETEINITSYLLHFCGKSIWRSGEPKEKTIKRERKYRKYFQEKWGKELTEQLLVQSSLS
jgi:GT2 family glycosyltransferase